MGKNKTHSIIKQLKVLAAELGQVPTRQDTRDAGIEQQVKTAFGSHTDALAAAGFIKTQSPKKKKDVLLKSVQSQLDKTQHENFILNPSPKVLIIGDCHFPWANTKSLSAVYQVCKELKPDIIIQIGDLYDCLSHSKFPRSMNNYNPHDEMNTGRAMAEDMWKQLKKIRPKARCIQQLGNHDIRPMRRLYETYPEGEVFFDFIRWFKFPGVETIEDHTQPLIINKVYYHHGHLSRLGAHRDANQANTIVGHSHLGGLSFRGPLWELNAGFIGDMTAKCFGYMPLKCSKSTQGVGWLDHWGPRFIPFTQ